MKRTIAATGAAAAVPAGLVVTAPTASAAGGAYGPNTRDAVSWRRIHHPSGGGTHVRL
ncbi:hypothetical protein [Streptomyces filamentosus]|uniref:hypothetical protein n=1 Tax=Streptomyces filamentosus TaxID=67294 RepID=UPI001478283A|nr:hypothetical protein [Streptomyces filamentosus]